MHWSSGKGRSWDDVLLRRIQRTASHRVRIPQVLDSSSSLFFFFFCLLVPARDDGKLSWALFHVQAFRIGVKQYGKPCNMPWFAEPNNKVHIQQLIDITLLHICGIQPRPRSSRVLRSNPKPLTPPGTGLKTPISIFQALYLTTLTDISELPPVVFYINVRHFC